MAEDKYTWDDVIIDPTLEEAKNAVGKECYFADNPTYCVSKANSDASSEVLGQVDAYRMYPFVNTNSDAYGCIIVKKEASYLERMMRWVEENDIKAGDYVRVLRKAEYLEDGWKSYWSDEMDDWVGETLRIAVVNTDEYGIQLENCYRFPYFVLEKVEKDELYSEHLKRWIEDNNVKAGDYVRVTRTVNCNDEYFNAVWTDEMDHCVGKTMRVLKVDDYSGITLENLCIFPYFVLEKVEEPKPNYVPFTSKEEFIEAFHYHDNANYSEAEDILMNYGMWIKSKDEGYFVQVWIITTSGIQTEYSCCPESWEDILANYTFLDGTPCGKLKEN